VSEEGSEVKGRVHHLAGTIDGKSEVRGGEVQSGINHWAAAGTEEYAAIHKVRRAPESARRSFFNIIRWALDLLPGGAPERQKRKRNQVKWKLNEVIDNMVRDYPTYAELDQAKQTTLMDKYSAGAGTVVDAKRAALQRLSQKRSQN